MRDEAYWPAAEEFRPERFLPEGSALAPSLPLDHVFTPFGGAPGPRACVRMPTRTACPLARHGGARKHAPPPAATKATPPQTTSGGGARLCIGFRFAQEEALITLVRLFQRFTFDLEPGVAPLKMVHRLTLSPADGVRARVVARA